MSTQNAIPASNNGIRKESTASPIECTRVYDNEFQKAGTHTAELKMVINTVSYYPSKKVDSNLNATLFNASDFGFTEKSYPSKETRMAWILVPVGTTIEQVQTQLASVPGATIYKVMSNAPILDDNQKFAVGSGLRTLDQFADSQVVRHGDTKPDGTPNPDAGKLIKDSNGNPFYRRTMFWLSKREDADLRTSDATKHFLSSAIKAELAAEKAAAAINAAGASILQNQTV